ncbi:MAG: hypothetical protein HOD68_00265 [Flavobacteriales bacterium]|nr:hypothetical protein [Flavobacteriales bacterium]
MKTRLTTLLSVLFCAITFAQSVPQGINYQAVARDSTGAVLMNQALTIHFSVISDITTSYVIWQETHTVSTNDYGLYTTIIGQGTPTYSGSLASFDVIDWGASNLFLKVEIDYGNGFVDMGTTAFMSVPYALYSANPGPRGFDANSSLWRWSNNPIVLGFGLFSTGTGLYGNSITNYDQKDQITGITVHNEDNFGTDLSQWLLFCDVGSTICIRAVQNPQQVAYYEVTNTQNFGTYLIKYLVNYIDGDGTPASGIPEENTFINDKEYYIGYSN